jgi:hypothetical protein
MAHCLIVGDWESLPNSHVKNPVHITPRKVMSLKQMDDAAIQHPQKWTSKGWELLQQFPVDLHCHLYRDWL